MNDSSFTFAESLKAAGLGAHRSWVEVSRDRIRGNCKAVREVVGSGVEILAVVKADAYGHGAVPVAKVLEEEGVRWFGVSNWGEGVALREGGISGRILVMADRIPRDVGLVKHYDLTPVVHSLEDLKELEEQARREAHPIRFHLKVDTGMSRLGTLSRAEEIAERILSLKYTRLEGLMTHLASSADYSSRQTEEQLSRFQRVLAKLRELGVRPDYVHLSSSNPVAYGRREAFGNMVRVGHALYGYISPAKGPAPPPLLKVTPVLSWKASILAVKDLAPGALVGYGGTYRVTRPSRIAILAAGYADGLPHRLSNRGKVIAGGRLAPIIGAVSMDLTTIDITETPWLKPGDTVTLIGQENGVQVNAQQIAKWAGTISYAVLCGIDARVPRLYV